MIFFLAFAISTCIGILAGMRTRVPGFIIVLVISLAALGGCCAWLGFGRSTTILLLLVSGAAIQLGYVVEILVFEAVAKIGWGSGWLPERMRGITHPGSSPENQQQRRPRRAPRGNRGSSQRL